MCYTVQLTTFSPVTFHFSSTTLTNSGAVLHVKKLDIMRVLYGNVNKWTRKSFTDTYNYDSFKPPTVYLWHIHVFYSLYSFIGVIMKNRIIVCTQEKS